MNTTASFCCAVAVTAFATTLPQPCSASVPSPWLVGDTSSWYPFNATGGTDPGDIGLADWLDKPAGRFGRISQNGSQLIYNGKPIKFWGINLNDADAGLSASQVDYVVALHAKYGTNLIRFHKFLEHWSPLRPGSGPHNFWLLDESAGGGAQRFDYFVKKLKDAGIYVNLSPSWHITISEGDRADVPYWREFVDSYTRGAPVLAQVVRDNRATTGSGTFSFRALNNGADISMGAKVYGVRGSFNLDLSKNTPPIALGGATVTELAGPSLTSGSASWVNRSAAVNFGTGYDYYVVVVWSDGFMERKTQAIDDLFLGVGTNIITNGDFADLSSTAVISKNTYRLLSDTDDDKSTSEIVPGKWEVFSSGVWKPDSTNRWFKATGGTMDHPNRPYVSTESGFGSVPAFIYFLEEFQELKIKQIETLLNRTNIHTNLKYASDPVVAFVEMHNETSIGWLNGYLENGWMTTLRSAATSRFSEWLSRKYGSHQNLVNAWGTAAFTIGQSIADKPTTPWPEAGFPNQNLDLRNIPPWVPNPSNLTDSRYRQRSLDTNQFLYEIQDAYYKRFRQRIRATGYQGLLIASNWNWSSQDPNYLNVATDREIGIIDRHQYSSATNESMLQAPGSEQLGDASAAHLSDRPFMFSEWAQNWENPNTLESRFINAAYGMGLQGWDAMTFLPGHTHYSAGTPAINAPMQFKNQYFNPNVLPAIPFLIRQIMRNDVAEGTVVAERLVHLDSLLQGQGLTFEDRKVTLGQRNAWEATTLDRTSTLIPWRTPAVAKTQVRFTTTRINSPAFNLAPYTEVVGSDTIYKATNGQLQWRVGQGTHDADLIVSTAATQGIVGFFQQDEVIDLPDVEIKILDRNQFAAIYVTASEPDKTLANSDKILLLALGRARNSGMVYSGSGALTNSGSAPVIMEPVQASVRFKRSGTLSVIKLTHDGLPDGGVAVNQAQRLLRIDGASHKTPYYAISLQGAPSGNPVVNGDFTSPLLGVTSWAFSTTPSHVGSGWLAQSSGSRWGIDGQGRASANNTGNVSGMVQIIRDNRATKGTQVFSFDAGNSHANQTLRAYIWGVNQDFRINLWDTNGPRDLQNSSVLLGTQLLGDAGLGANVMPWPTRVSYQNVQFGTGYDYIVIEFFTGGVDTSQGRWQFLDNVAIGGGGDSSLHEAFDWASSLTSTPASGTASGAGGVTWSYSRAAQDATKQITGTTLILTRFTGANSLGSLQATLPAAYARGSLDIKPRFHGKAQVRVLVNGGVVATSPVLDGHADQRTFTFTLNAPAGAVLRIETTGQTTTDWKDCLIDNLKLDRN